jgi:asparagine synthase (glutamine-hydrolysing)
MPNVLMIVDPDADRRIRFIDAIRPKLPILDGLRSSSCAVGHFHAVWASSHKAPISQSIDKGGAAVLWGDAIPGPGPQRIDAAGLQSTWINTSQNIPEPFDGYYMGVVYRPDVGITIGGDILGMFPIYYYATQTFVLLGTSPELFRYHPEVRIKFNPRALVGILLLMHPIDGDTFFQDVRRLRAGHLLSWRPGYWKETKQYQVPVSDRYFDWPFSAQVEALDHTTREAVGRHAPASEPYGLLLSGGRDSRMLGGYLRQHHNTAIALTLGNSAHELDVKCGRAVAGSLRFQHRWGSICETHYAHYADIHSRWTHGLGGFDHLMFWDFHRHLRDLPARVVTGYVMDSIIGGSHIEWAYSASARHSSFAAFFSKINSFGFSPNCLKGLLKTDMSRDLVDESLQQLRSLYAQYADSEAQRAWCFDLYHRQRFFIGNFVWLASFGAWPVLPAVDRGVLAAAGGMPAATLSERRAQDSILCRQFPDLAAIPLESSTYHPSPLIQRFRWQVLQQLRYRVPFFFKVEEWSNIRKGERRFYHRLWDVNGAAWMSIRREAHAYRETVLDLFDKDMLDRVLPSPHVHLAYEEPIAGASGLKTLLGFLLWSRDHSHTQ